MSATHLVEKISSSNLDTYENPNASVISSRRILVDSGSEGTQQSLLSSTFDPVRLQSGAHELVFMELDNSRLSLSIKSADDLTAQVMKRHDDPIAGPELQRKLREEIHRRQIAEFKYWVTSDEKHWAGDAKINGSSIIQARFFPIRLKDPLVQPTDLKAAEYHDDTSINRIRADQNELASEARKQLTLQSDPRNSLQTGSSSDIVSMLDGKTNEYESSISGSQNKARQWTMPEDFSNNEHQNEDVEEIPSQASDNTEKRVEISTNRQELVINSQTAPGSLGDAQSKEQSKDYIHHKESYEVVGAKGQTIQHPRNDEAPDGSLIDGSTHGMHQALTDKQFSNSPIDKFSNQNLTNLSQIVKVQIEGQKDRSDQLKKYTPQDQHTQASNTEQQMENELSEKRNDQTIMYKVEVDQSQEKVIRKPSINQANKGSSQSHAQGQDVQIDQKLEDSITKAQNILSQQSQDPTALATIPNNMLSEASKQLLTENFKTDKEVAMSDKIKEESKEREPEFKDDAFRKGKRMLEILIGRVTPKGPAESHFEQVFFQQLRYGQRYLKRKDQHIWKISLPKNTKNDIEIDKLIDHIQTHQKIKIFQQTQPKKIDESTSTGEQQLANIYFISKVDTKISISSDLKAYKGAKITEEYMMENVEHELAQDMHSHFNYLLEDQDSLKLKNLMSLIKHQPIIEKFELPDFLCTHFKDDQESENRERFLVLFLTACTCNTSFSQFQRVNEQVDRLAMVGQFAITLCTTLYAFLNRKPSWKGHHLIKEVEKMIKREEFVKSYNDELQFPTIDGSQLKNGKTRSKEQILMSILGFLSMFIGMRSAYTLLKNLNFFPKVPQSIESEEQAIRERETYFKNDSFMRFIEKILLQKMPEICNFNNPQKKNSEYFATKIQEVVTSATKLSPNKAQNQIRSKRDIAARAGAGDSGQEILLEYKFEHRYLLTQAFTCQSFEDLLSRALIEGSVNLGLEDFNKALELMKNDEMDKEFVDRMRKQMSNQNGYSLPTLMRRIFVEFPQFNNELIQIVGQAATAFALMRAFYEDTEMADMMWFQNYYHADRLREIMKYFSSNVYEGFLLYEHYHYSNNEIDQRKYLNQVRGPQIEKEKLNDVDIPRVPILFNSDSSQLKQKRDLHEHNCLFLMKEWSAKNVQDKQQSISISGLEQGTSVHSTTVAPIISDLQGNLFNIYGEVFSSIVGAILIDSCDLEKTLSYAVRMLQSRFINHFPYQESVQEKLTKIMASKPYTANIKLSHEVVHKPEEKAEYIKIYFNHIECRRLKFNLQQTDRVNKAFGDAQRFYEEATFQFEILLANKQLPTANHFSLGGSGQQLCNFEEDFGDVGENEVDEFENITEAQFLEYVKSFRKYYEQKDYKKDKQLLSRLSLVVGKQKRIPNDFRSLLEKQLNELHYNFRKEKEACHFFSSGLMTSSKQVFHVPLVIDLRHEVTRWKIVRDALQKCNIDLMKASPHLSARELVDTITNEQLRYLFLQLKRLSKLVDV